VCARVHVCVCVVCVCVCVCFGGGSSFAYCIWPLVFQSSGKYIIIIIIIIIDVMNKYGTEDRQMLMPSAGGLNLHCSHLALSLALARQTNTLIKICQHISSGEFNEVPMTC